MNLDTRARIAIIVALALLNAVSPARAGDPVRTPDGFYLPDETGMSPLMVEIEDPDGAVHVIPVIPYEKLTIRRVSAYPVPWTNNVYQVQVNLVSSDEGWTKKPIVLVAAGRAVIELDKTGGRGMSGDGPIQVSPVITFEVRRKELAEQMKDKLIELRDTRADMPKQESTPKEK
jgi:hypothetical protein